MKNNFLISVIIPVFNREKYIGRCLRSLLNQSIERNLYEIIVIDDGSTDHTRKIINSFSDEVIFLSKKKNSGLSNAINLGIKKSRGKFIIRVDSDDYVNKDFLKILYLFLKDNKELDAVACDYYLVNDKEQIIKKVNCFENPIACGILFRAEQIKKIGLYKPGLLINEEIEFRKRFEKKYKITRVQLPLYRYRRHKTNLTNQRK